MSSTVETIGLTLHDFLLRSREFQALTSHPCIRKSDLLLLEGGKSMVHTEQAIGYCQYSLYIRPRGEGQSIVQCQSFTRPALGCADSPATSKQRRTRMYTSLEVISAVHHVSSSPISAESRISDEHALLTAEPASRISWIQERMA